MDQIRIINQGNAGGPAEYQELNEYLTNHIEWQVVDIKTKKNYIVVLLRSKF